jgi:AraC family transcriptional regulator, chemosensory pili system protein ChpD
VTAAPGRASETASPRSVALNGCRVDRTVDPRIEIVEAAPANRAFPARVTECLGVCLKAGPSHDVRTDGRAVSYPADALCVRPPGCIWGTAATGVVGFLSIDIPASLLPSELGVRRMVFGKRAGIPEFRRIVTAARRTQSRARLEELVTLLVLALEHAGAIRADELRHSAHARTSGRMRALLEGSLVEPPTLVELAERLGLSRFALMRRFKSDFGITPHAFVLRLRVERARERLARGSDLRDLAHELGFADQSHFTRVFKSVVGMTPGAYAACTRAVVQRP